MTLTHWSAEEIARYVDGELSSGEAALMEEHLESCDICREELEQLRILDISLKLNENRQRSSKLFLHYPLGDSCRIVILKIIRNIYTSLNKKDSGDTYEQNQTPDQ